MNVLGSKIPAIQSMEKKIDSMKSLDPELKSLADEISAITDMSDMEAAEEGGQAIKTVLKAEGDKLSGEIETAAAIENDAVAEKEMAAEAEQITSKPVAEATETVKDEEDPEADAGAIAEDD